MCTIGISLVPSGSEQKNVNKTLAQSWKKAGSTGSAEPNFFQILRQICPVFRQIITKLIKFDKISTKILPDFYQICD